MRFDDDSPLLPFPFWDVSNGEFCPRPPSEAQRRAVAIFQEEAARRAHRLGLSRRRFMLSAAGMATAYLAVNRAFGADRNGDNAALPVDLEHTWDETAARELLGGDYFVMDVQLHHVNLDDPILNIPPIAAAVGCLRFVPPDVTCTQAGLDMLGQANLAREVFVEGDTDFGVISGVPDGFPMPPETMAETRDLVNSFAGTERAVCQATCDPLTSPGSVTSIDSLERQVNELGGVALKTYTGNDNWYLDDEDVAYPMLDEVSRLGLSLVNVHKGLPGILGNDAERYVVSRDFPKVLRDWPDLKFAAYHSGYFPEAPAGREIEEFLSVVRSLPPEDKPRLYAEVGSSFALAMTQGPTAAAFFIGSLLRDVGSSNILWGTDSIWWGTPRWQVNAFKSLTIPVSMQERYGFPELTDEDKARILGLNAAELYGIDVEAKQREIAEDGVMAARAENAAEDRVPSHGVYGPRTRREFLGFMRRAELDEARRKAVLGMDDA